MSVIVWEEPPEVRVNGWAQEVMHQVTVNLAKHPEGLKVSVRSPDIGLRTVTLTWNLPLDPQTPCLGDAWERGYGDLAWRPVHEARVMPWYAAWLEGPVLKGAGVRTRPGSLASWRLDGSRLELTLDVRSGSRELWLGDRTLEAATVVFIESTEGAFSGVRDLCAALCSSPRLPASPVYGANDWYYAYGQNSADQIVEDSLRTSTWAGSHPNRPFSVVDAGWQLNNGCEGGPWFGNERFGDMKALADRIRATGCRPGLWIRPLLTCEPHPEEWFLKPQTLDPSVPEVLAKVQTDMERIVNWGYDLIKHDFTTWDCAGLWGFEMTERFFGSEPSFRDNSRTTAEILRDLYDAIRESAGSATLIGCNTVGHLAAGTHEIQRTGDDTSGREWVRTRQMGVNTLAFRAPQHGTFFAADADCVGITNHVPWELNRQWLDAVARSGTPLFVSAAKEALGREQEDALRAAFALAAEEQPLAQPLDWLAESHPARWMSGEQVREYPAFSVAE